MKEEAEIPMAQPVTRRRRRGRTVIVVVTAVTVTGLAAVGWVVLQTSTGGDAQATQEVKPSVAVTTEAVVRTDISNRRIVNGNLGYAGSVDIAAGRAGVMTWVPAVGDVIKRGKPIFEIDGVRVPLLYGERPAWRDLRLGVRDGVDVLQLERNLKALGYGDNLTVDKHYSLSTYYAVRRWQKKSRLPVTGSVPLGQIAYAQGEVRVAKREIVAGGRVGPGQRAVHGTGTQAAVLVDLNPAELPKIQVGDPVVVTLPDGKTRKAKITTVAKVASTSGAGGGDETSVAPVTIALKKKVKGFLDRAIVQVAITADQHKNVLAVPVTSLMARTLGNYELVVVNGGVRQRVPVETGLFDETSGLAEVKGAISEGTMVEVPR